MLANNDMVMKEMERREQSWKAQRRSAIRQPRKTRCQDCMAETEADENGVSICVSCAQWKLAVTPETVRSVLQQELTWAAERASIASAEFLAVTSEIPSGLPQPDGVQRIRNVSHELAFARAQLTKAHGRLEGFLISGITPNDLKWINDE
jgi:hypothetical protein